MSIALSVRQKSCPQEDGALPISLYLVFALADLCFSLIAFSNGIAEGNPFMAWLLHVGLFVPGKIVVSLAVALVMAMVFTHSRRGWAVTWGGVAIMGAVVAYHLWALPQILRAG